MEEPKFIVGDIVKISDVAKGVITPTPGTLIKYQEWNVMLVPSGSITTCRERILELEYRTVTQDPRQAGCFVVNKEKS